MRHRSTKSINHVFFVSTDPAPNLCCTIVNWRQIIGSWGNWSLPGSGLDYYLWNHINLWNCHCNLTATIL